MNKKLLIIVGILILILLGLAGWYFLLRATPAVTTIAGPSALPFGQGGAGNIAVSVNPDGTKGSTGVDQTGKPIAQLFRITDTPVAGMIGFIKNGSTAIRYVDRATGHIFDVDPATLTITQITNDTLPKTYQAVFKNDASSVVFRSLEDDSNVISNLSIVLTPPAASSTDSLYSMTQTPLKGNIDELISTGSTLVSTFKDSGSIVSSNFDGSKPITLFTSAFSNWTILPEGSVSVALVTKPSVSADGFAYALNMKSGGLSKIFGPLNGLFITPNADGSKILYSYNSGSAFGAQTISNGSTLALTPTTLADKCVWNEHSKVLVICGVPSNIDTSEPDNWYQGTVHFSDRIWQYNTDTGFTDVLVDPKKDFNTDIDVMNPILTPDDDYLVFINKNDLTLWALKLSQE